MTVAIALLSLRMIKLLERLKRTIETELAIRRAVAELSELNDHMLRDLGITRGDIETVVRQPGVRAGMDEDIGDKTTSIVPGIVVMARRPDDDPVRSLPPRAAA